MGKTLAVTACMYTIVCATAGHIWTLPVFVLATLHSRHTTTPAGMQRRRGRCVVLSPSIHDVEGATTINCNAYMYLQAQGIQSS